MYDVNNFDTASATIIPLKYKPPLFLLQIIIIAELARDF